MPAFSPNSFDVNAFSDNAFDLAGFVPFELIVGSFAGVCITGEVENAARMYKNIGVTVCMQGTVEGAGTITDKVDAAVNIND